MDPLLVLGMHRSGTSLAASLLASAGLHVGDRLLGANASNPRGHFEDEDFIEFESAALRALGMDGDGWVVADPPPIPDRLTTAARALLERKQASGRAWGWKDPRAVPLLPLWRPLLPEARFVIVYRAPWEVVDSLFRRGDAAFVADPELAVRVWTYYNQRLLDLALAVPASSVVCSAETVSAHPAAWVAHVVERLGTRLGAPDTTVVERALLHGTGGDARRDQLFRLYPDVAELYARLEGLAYRPAGSAPVVPALRRSASREERELVLRDWAASAWAARERRQAAAPSPGVAPAATTAGGWCSCCRQATTFIETGTWLRDQFLCEQCRSIPRFRAVNHILDRYCEGWEQAAVLELSPPADFVRRHARHYTGVAAVQGEVTATPSGAERLERLSFPDGTFDVVVTQDLLEHVLAPEVVLREIGRVLKPGGAHVFTAPKHRGLRVSRQRARLEDGAVRHLLDPMYHGDPLAPDRELVSWDFGDDMEALVARWSGAPAVSYVVRDRGLGLDGEYLEVFLVRNTP